MQCSIRLKRGDVTKWGEAHGIDPIKCECEIDIVVSEMTRQLGFKEHLVMDSPVIDTRSDITIVFDDHDHLDLFDEAYSYLYPLPEPPTAKPKPKKRKRKK